MRPIVALAFAALIRVTAPRWFRQRPTLDRYNNDDYTAFAGIERGAKVKATILRGSLVCDNGNIIGKPRGRYLRRPTT